MRINVRHIFFCLKIIIATISLALVSCSDDLQKNDTDILQSKKEIDSVYFYITNSHKSLPKSNGQNIYLNHAISLNSLVKNDTSQKTNHLKIAYKALNISDSISFNFSNNSAYKLAKIQKDTSAIAEIFWNKAVFNGNKNQLDSAYYFYNKAYRFYKKTDNKFYTGKMLYNMASIQSKFNDFKNSEENAFKAINNYKEVDKFLSIYRCYNMLGAIFGQQDNFNYAIQYYNMAFEALDNVDPKKKRTYYERNLNDLAAIYQKQGDYDNAILTYKKALENKELKHKNTSLYARLKDNLANAYLLKGSTDLFIEKELKEALYIRNENKNRREISTSQLHLAEYYLKTKDTLKAIEYANDSYFNAKKTNNKSSLILCLLFLSKYDTYNTSEHLNNYVELSRKLNENQTKQNNKFARILYQTKEIEDENQKLSTQQDYITTIGIGFVMVLSLLFLIGMQRFRNRQLQLEQSQQKANQEIYKLMLKQQSKLEEGRLNERYRISEELHDGILGKIFGTRMGLAFLDINADKATKDKFQKFIDELQDVEKEMRMISHDLKNEILTSKTDFVSIIDSFLNDQEEITNIKFSINKDSDINWNSVNDDIKINIYRVIQEATQNIIKHADAKNANISLVQADNEISLTITDDDKGFDINKIKRKGIGLQNMESRINSLGGDFHIESEEGVGTKSIVTIPFPDTNKIEINT